MNYFRFREVDEQLCNKKLLAIEISSNNNDKDLKYVYKFGQ